MNQPTIQAGFSPPWFLILGLLAGIAFVGFIVWDAAGPAAKTGSSGSVVELTQANWQKEVVESEIPVVVDFTASWCPPCKAFAPTVEKVAERYKGRVKVAKFDVGDHGFNKAKKLQARYGFEAIPHTMIFKGGDEPRRRLGGAVSEAVLASAIDGVLASP